MFHIYLTAPRGAAIGGFRMEIEDRWQESARLAEAAVHIHEPNEFEIHGDLLSRLWLEEWYDKIEAGDDILISECDFVPQPPAAPALLRHPGFVLARYVTRDYLPGADTNVSPGRLRAHRIEVVDPTTKRSRQLPLIGPWLMKLPGGDWVRKMPRDWLGASGPFNDAANLALFRLLEAGAITKEHPLTLLKHRDLHPMLHGVVYENLGAHSFFARDLDAEDTATLCWQHAAVPLTAARHRAGLGKYLWSTSPLSKLSKTDKAALARSMEETTDAVA